MMAASQAVRCGLSTIEDAMTISERKTQFAGLPVRGFAASSGFGRAPGGVAWRLETDDYDAPLQPVIEAFLSQPDLDKVEAIVIGHWGEAFEGGPDGLALLLAASSKLPALRGLFIGDMTYEECEISWINQGSMNEVLDALPQLEVFGVRGGSGLSLTPTTHGLRELIVETGGLDAGVIEAIGASTFVKLEKLELWIGDENYGAPSNTTSLAGIYAGTGFPSLLWLGLMNSELSDTIASELCSAPVVARLQHLDLSMGTLGDDGAQALSGGPFGHLQSLNLDHHYVSDAALARLRAALPGVAISANGREDEGEYGRYVEVSE